MPEFRGRLRNLTLASAPSTPAAGEQYFDSALSQLRWWNGSAWVTAAFPADTVVPSGTRIIANKLLAADTQPDWRLDGNGKIEWGAGGSNALDTNLYRPAANTLKTDNFFTIGRSLTVNDGTAYMSGLGESGGIPVLSLGDGFLRRPSAGVLKSDGPLQSSGDISVFTDPAVTPNPQIKLTGNYQGIGLPGIQFGAGGSNALDTNLYRAAAGLLRTDGGLAVGPTANPAAYATGVSMSSNGAILAVTPGVAGTALYTTENGNGAFRFLLTSDGKMHWSASGSGPDTYLYRSAANVLKTDGTFNAYAINANGSVGITLNGAIQCWFDDVGLRRLICGPADSAGAGYRTIKIAN